jgi:Fe2+ transport system protein B
MFKFVKQSFCNHKWKTDKLAIAHRYLGKQPYICEKCGKEVTWSRDEFEEYGDDTILIPIIAIILWIVIAFVIYQLIF